MLEELLGVLHDLKPRASQMGYPVDSHRGQGSKPFKNPYKNVRSMIMLGK